MLSEREYNDTNHALHNISSIITGKHRQNLRQALKKKLKEHRYALTYEPFTQSPYKFFFINYTTTEKTLIHLSETINLSSIFIIDTESICVLNKPNKPALIQLQILPPDSISYVILIEVCHLPRTTTTTFTLIKQLFNLLFNPEKKNYIWGDITKELEKFTTLELFSLDQIYLSENVCLQDSFKINWNEHHPHRTLSHTDDDSKCICETCIGIQQNNPWGLQDSVAYELNRWLDKRQTISAFNVGLDPNMKHLNDKELEYRQTLIKYAVDDCLSMQQIVSSMGLIDTQQPSHSPHKQDNKLPENYCFELNTPTIEFLENENNFFINQDAMIHSTERIIPLITHKQSNLHDWELISSNDDDSTLIISTTQSTISNDHISTNLYPVREDLSAEQRRKIHNRSCTLRQRKRYYRNEIIYHNIDPRFRIKQIETILKEKNIRFTAINTSRSKTTNQISLFIGIRDKSYIPIYQNQIRHLFNTRHFNELKQHHRRLYSSSQSHRTRPHH